MDKNHFLMSSGASEWASEQTNERSGAREQYGEIEWVCAASGQVSGWANGPVVYASISYSLQPLCIGLIDI